MSNILDGLKQGIIEGWWEGIDEEAKLPTKVFKRSDFHEYALLAHAWVRLGKFKSVKEAKRSGHNKPLKIGTYRLGTWMMRIE